MSLTLAQIFEQASAQADQPLVGYVFDSPIHYIVLKQQDNKLSFEFFQEIHVVLDKIEATTGPGVVVTIGVGKRHFSTGFDMT